ncbi:MAG: TA system VapC family ribonuclease toxin [Acidimicrobiia bacterium]
MSAVLLDANVLIAVAVADHVHHDAAEEWFSRRRGRFATCPITQGALIRLIIRHGADAAQAMGVLAGVTKQKAHQFWPDELDFGKVAMTGVLGHRQVTDAYLAALARHHGGRLATFDQGLAALHPDVALTVPLSRTSL